MIGTIDVKVQAHNPNFPLDPVFTFVNSSQSFRIRDVPKRIGNWSITNVFVNITYPDNTVISKECLLVGGVWVGTVDGCSTSGEVENGFVVTASGIDENNQTVSNYVLGAGDIYVKQLDGSISPGTTAVRMYFYETLPTTPNEGDSTFIEGVLNVYDGTQWKPALEVDLTNYYDKDEIDDIIENVEESIPTKTSDLTNDSGFITVNEVPTPSYIEDSNGNKIEADLDCHVKNLTLPWTFNGVQLKYKRDFYWEYERNDQKYVLLFIDGSIPFSGGEWSLASFRWNGSDWDVVKYDRVFGSVDETSLYFENFGETATRSIIETNRLALISEVPTSFDKIQDSVGNVINANRNVTKIEFGDYCWQYTTTGNPGNIYVMTGTKELSEYYLNETDKFQLSYDNNTWSLKYILNGNTRWTLTSEGNLTDTDLTFNNIVIFNFTWKQATTEVSDTVALVSQIPTKTSDLTNDSGFVTTSQIPTVNNSTITLTQGGVTKGSFSLNQSSPQTIDLDAGGGGGDNGYTVTVNIHRSEGNWQAGNVKIGGINITIQDSTDRNTLLFDGLQTTQGQKKFYSQSYIIIGNNTEPCVYVDGVAKNNTVVELSADATVDMYNLVCIAGGTLVSLSNGTTKPIEEVTYEDELLVWNFDECKLDSAKPTWIKRADYIFFHWKTDLTSGKSINTCGQWGHRFFDLTSNTWVYASDIEGKTIYTLDGADEVVSSKRIEGGKVYFYNIITKKHINLFCNDILTGCSLENKLYPVEGMKFVKDNRVLRPYSEFENDVPEYWFNDCRYAESNATREYLVEYYNRRKSLAL